MLRLEALADGMAEQAIVAYMENKRTTGKRIDVVEKHLKTLDNCFKALERDNYFHNSFLSLAHLAVAAALGYMDFRLPDMGWREDSHRLADWYDGFAGRESMKKTVPLD